MGVETAAAVVAIGGTALQMYGQYEQAQQQASAAKKNAEAKRLMADDLLKRSEYNIAETKKEGDAFASEQMGAYFKAGVALEGSVLLALEDTAYKVSQNMLNQQREANDKARALYMGADIDTQLSGDIQKATYINMAGTAMSTASKIDFSQLSKKKEDTKTNNDKKS
jgi:hypothetical protein